MLVNKKNNLVRIKNPFARWWRIGFLICLLSVSLGFVWSNDRAGAVGYSSPNYRMKVEDIDESGGQLDSGDFSVDEALNYFVTGKFTSPNYIVKAGYLYFKPPNKPEIGIPEGLSASAIKWNFTDRSADEEGFLLEDDSATVVEVVNQANISSITQTGLDENQKYTEQVLAFNPFGNSIPSGFASGCTLVGTRGLFASPGVDYMDLSVPIFPRHSIELSGYFFRRGVVNESGWQSGDNSWRDTGLNFNTAYTWHSKQRNICGVENAEATLTRCTLANVPGQPGVSYVAADDGTYTATISIAANGNPAGTEFAVLVNGAFLQPDGSVSGASYWSTALSRAHYGLVAGQTYVYNVMARNCNNISTDLSLPATITIPGIDVPPVNPPLTIPELIITALRDLLRDIELFRENPVTQLINQSVVVPGLTALAIANLLTAAGMANVGTALLSFWYLFTEPFLFFAGRRRRCWGVVYNALSKVPVDLALVRLLDAQTGKLVSTRVTDRQGRFTFLTKEGKFRITVTKPNFAFPSLKMRGKTHDAGYDDLYFGEPIEIASGKTVITVSVPLDPMLKQDMAMTNRNVVLRYLHRRVNLILAILGPVIAAVCLWISPSIYTMIFLILHIVLFIFFGRVVQGQKSKPWGMVYDAKTGKPVGLAVVRLFNRRYNDLLETQVTDRHGRFGFLVGPETYRLTVDREQYAFPSKIEKGFNRYRGEDFNVKRDGVVRFNVPLDPATGLPYAPTSPNAAPPPPPETPGMQETIKKVEEKKDRNLEDLSGPDS